MKQLNTLRTIVMFVCVFALSHDLFAQLKVGGTEESQTTAYATIYVRVNAKTNVIIYDIEFGDHSPVVFWPDQSSEKLVIQDGTRTRNFTRVSQLLNYMGSKGYKLISSNVVDEISTYDEQYTKDNIYLQVLIFEK